MVICMYEIYCYAVFILLVASIMFHLIYVYSVRLLCRKLKGDPVIYAAAPTVAYMRGGRDLPLRLQWSRQFKETLRSALYARYINLPQVLSTLCRLKNTRGGSGSQRRILNSTSFIRSLKSQCIRVLGETKPMVNIFKRAGTRGPLYENRKVWRTIVK